MNRFFFFALASAAVLFGLAGCDKDDENAAGKGDVIKFSVKAGESEEGTPVYGTPAGGGKDLLIKWQDGTKVKVVKTWQNESLYAASTESFKIKNATASGSAGLEIVDPEKESFFLWEEDADLQYMFFALYPLTMPAGQGYLSYTCTPSVPSTQGNAGISKDSNGDWTVEPDMNNMPLVARIAGKRAEIEPLAFDFVPFVTAVKVTFTNGIAGESMQIKSVALESDVTDQKLNGSYTTTLSDPWTTPDDVSNYWSSTPYKYRKAYPVVGTLSGGTTSVSIATPADPKSEYLTLDSGKSLTATFFLQATQNLSDLRFRITFSDNTSKSIAIKCNLPGDTDADHNRITFPRFAKSYLTGLVLDTKASADGGLEAVWDVRFE